MHLVYSKLQLRKFKLRIKERLLINYLILKIGPPERKLRKKLGQVPRKMLNKGLESSRNKKKQRRKPLDLLRSIKKNWKERKKRPNFLRKLRNWNKIPLKTKSSLSCRAWETKRFQRKPRAPRDQRTQFNRPLHLRRSEFML